jgi:hypothetical protein
MNLKTFLFRIHWLWKNRNWTNTKYKLKALNRELDKLHRKEMLQNAYKKQKKSNK